MNPTSTTSRKPYFNSGTKVLFLNRKQLPKNFKDKLNWASNDDVQEYSMLVCPIKAEDEVMIDVILNTNTSDEERETLLSILKTNYPHVNFDKILMYGDANKQRTSYRQFEFVIQYFYTKSSMHHGQHHETLFLRSYERSYESWKESSALVNLCSDDKMAWQSIIRKLGGYWVKGLNNTFQPFRIVVWADPITENECIDKYGV